MPKYCKSCNQFKKIEYFKEKARSKCNECADKKALSLIKFKLEKANNVKNISKTIWCMPLRIMN